MLYFVATPIGNLGDITYRAVQTLKSVDVIACEDTRNSKKLLDFYEINKPLIAYHKFNESVSSDGIIKLLRDGKNVAVISDGGMPLISDPGLILSQKLNDEGIEFTVVPGANAGLTALLLSGFDSSLFTFVGFLPEKNSKKSEIMKKIRTLNSTLIFHISVHSISDDLEFLFQNLGTRKACLVREMTKMFEEKMFFTLGDKIEVTEKGEFVLIVEGQSEKSSQNLCELSIDEHLNFYLSQGFDKKEAIKQVAKDRNVKKDEIYKTTINN